MNTTWKCFYSVKTVFSTVSEGVLRLTGEQPELLRRFWPIGFEEWKFLIRLQNGNFAVGYIDLTDSVGSCQVYNGSKKGPVFLFEIESTGVRFDSQTENEILRVSFDFI